MMIQCVGHLPILQDFNLPNIIEAIWRHSKYHFYFWQRAEHFNI